MDKKQYDEDINNLLVDVRNQLTKNDFLDDKNAFIIILKIVLERFEGNDDGLQEKVVSLNRVSKTVKGGRVARFAALMIVGDENGHVGYGLGKAAEVPEAIRKGIEDAKKNMIEVSLKDGTIPHEVLGEFGAGRVLLKPAAPGTGIIAGKTVRAVVELAGVKNIRVKSLRSNNPTNVIKATFEGLKSLRTAEQVAKTRGISVEQVIKG